MRLGRLLAGTGAATAAALGGDDLRRGLRAIEEADCYPKTRVGIFKYETAAGPPEAGHWRDNPCFEIKGIEVSSGWEQELLYVAVSEGGELDREDWDRIVRDEKIQVRKTFGHFLGTFGKNNK
eukprot:5630424-Pyramimonas_sp.AAC.1